MGALIGIAAIVIYYAIISNFIDAGSAPTGLVATAYVFVPLIGIPLVVGAVRSGIKPTSKAQHLKAIASIAGFVGLGIAGVLLAARMFTPGAPDPVADEQSRQAIWVARGQEAVKAKLKDPGSAQFRAVFFNRGKDGLPVTCGEVNSKNSFGGYSGHQKFVSAGKPERTYLEEQMAAGEFAKVWNTLCAK
jgi:hypothetical protein